MSKQRRRCSLCNKRTSTFHRFPKNPERLALWKEACNYSEKDVVKTLGLCSNHFTIDDYIEPNAKQLGNTLRLKPNVVPSINVPQKQLKYITLSDGNKEHTIKTDEIGGGITSETSHITSHPRHTAVLQSCDNFTPGPELCIANNSQTTTNITENSSLDCSNEMSLSDISTEDCFFSTPKKRKYAEPRYMNEVRSTDFATPRQSRKAFHLAKQQAIKYQKKYEAAVQTIARLKKKVKSLEDLLLTDLKS